MSLEVDRIYRVYCPICDWMRNYNCKGNIPSECPACGGNFLERNKIWEARKEVIHERLWSGFPSLEQMQE
jgi:Zn-finger nucleic acid-binding protein